MGYGLRFGSFFLFLPFALFALNSHADSCEPLYRSAYLEHTRTPQVELREAVSIYLIHFDYSNGLAEAFIAARPIFSALNTSPEDEDKILKSLSAKIKSGELCPGGIRYTLAQVIEALK